MSIQSEFDLALVGNITIDDVYAIHGWPSAGTSNRYESNRKSVGGLGNIIEALAGRLKLHVEAVVGDDRDGRQVAEYLQSRGATFVLHKSTRPTTKAVIFSDVANNERTSFVEWGCGRDPFKPMGVSAKWAHMSYADIAPIDMSALRASCGTLSTDVCLSTPPPGGLPPLGGLDLLFVSEVEFDAYGPSLYQLGPRLVLHGRSFTSIDGNAIHGNHKLVQGLDVLGAGDAYCAGFVLASLGGEGLRGAALAAHEEATRFLVGRAAR